MIDFTLEFLETYFWHMAAIGVAPVLGFIVGQYQKLNRIEKGEPKPTTLESAGLNGAVTFGITLWFWPGPLEEAAKIALTTGIGWPVLIWLWFTLASKWAPKHAESLKGSGNEMTILPWVKLQKKQKKSGEKDV